MDLTPEKLSEMAARLVTNAEEGLAKCEEVGLHRDVQDENFNKNK